MTAPSTPAFPHPSGAQGCDGMTLRQWYAGQALAGPCSDVSEYAQAAIHAFAYADAMIAAEQEQG